MRNVNHIALVLLFCGFSHFASAQAPASDAFEWGKVDQPIDINQAIQMGVDFQPRLGIENANVKKAELLNEIEKNNWQPSVQLNVSKQLSADLDDRAIPFSQAVRTVGIDVTQDLNFARLGLKRKVAKSSLDVSSLQRDGQVANIELGIATLYLEALRFSQLYDVAVKRQVLYEQFEAIVAKRKALGVASELEVARITATIKRGKSEESFLKRRLRDALSILSNNIGVERIDPKYLVMREIELDLSTPEQAQEMLKTIFANNYMLRAAKESLRLAGLNYEDIKWDRYPTINLTLSHNHKQYKEGANGENQLMMAQVSFPIWDGLERAGNVAVASTDIEIAKYRMLDQQLSLVTKFNEVRGTFKTALDEYNYALAAKEEAGSLLKLQELSFKESDETSVVEAVSGVAEWSTSSQRVVNALIDVFTAEYEILNLANTKK